MAFTYEYPRPAVTADVVLFAVRDGELKVLLIRRGAEPFKGKWAFPGGFVEEDEDLDACARRELHEETGIEAADIQLFANFSAPGRDPRGRTITAAYYAMVDSGAVRPAAGSDAAGVGWFPAAAPPPLAFDHAEILAKAMATLRARQPREGTVPGAAPKTA